MHILLNMSGMLAVILLGNVLVLRLLRLFRDWSQRQVLQLLVLMTPLVSLIVFIGGLQHALNTVCLLNHPAWNALLDRTVLILVGCSIIGALGLGISRFVLMKWLWHPRLRRSGCTWLMAHPLNWRNHC